MVFAIIIIIIIIIIVFSSEQEQHLALPRLLPPLLPSAISNTE
jgi:hypothetical protein